MTPSVISFAGCRRDFLIGEDTPRRFLERCLAAIEGHERSIRAFAAIDIAGARRAADHATRRYRARRPQSWLDGCPIGIKDIIDTADLPTEMNSPIYRGRRPVVDAACVRALRESGAVILGKTTTMEFAGGRPPPTRNPYSPVHSPGGSSTGSAAAVGAGFVPVAIGTQTGGSIIRPASYCGAVGWKPTYGAINPGGVHPLAPSLDHVGVLAATVADAWIAGWAMANGAGPQPGWRTIQGIERPPAPAKLRRVARLFFGEWDKTDAPSRERFEQFLDRLREKGVAVVDRRTDRDLAQLERDFADAADDTLHVITYEMRWPFWSYRDEHPAKVSRRFKHLMAPGAGVTHRAYERYLERKASYRRRVLALRRRFDAFVGLSTSGIPPRSRTDMGSRANQTAWTWLGFPALSLPILFAQGLPLGVQLMGYPDEDRLLIAQARSIARLVEVV